MRKLMWGITLLLGLALLVPASALGQKKPGKVKEEPAAKEDYDALKQVKEIEGTLLYVESSNHLMTVKVPYQILEANPAYKPGKNSNAQYNNWLRQQQNLLN